MNMWDFNSFRAKVLINPKGKTSGLARIWAEIFVSRTTSNLDISRQLEYDKKDRGLENNKFAL